VDALADDAPGRDAQPGFFLDLADRGVLGPLAGLDLANDERPGRLAIVAVAVFIYPPPAGRGRTR
jgi:hypothetical protein